METIVEYRYANPPALADDMPHADVWVWEPKVGYWVEETLVPGVEPNAGGSPAPVEDGLEEQKGGE